MIQQKLKLSFDLKQTLSDCDEIWVAVAMISDRGFKYIQDSISKTAKQNYLVGIGLPTSPYVLRALMDLNENGIFESRIHHKPDELFHPKVYVIKSGNKLIAYVGSGNCTDGGFDKNVELSIKTDDQELCNNLIKWFNTLFKHSTKITKEFLESYELIFDKRINRIKEDKKELKSININREKTNLDEIDFRNQFFKKEDFEAFEGNRSTDRSILANQAREKVRSKLFKLNDILHKEIQNRKWNLSEHYIFNDIVSSAVHGEYTSNKLNAIWLHYGRDKKEIKSYGEDHTPLDYMRLQIIVHSRDIGIWNRIGKDNGSRIDRDNLNIRLRTEKLFREEFFNVIKLLPNEYFIRRNNEKKYVYEFETEKELTQYLLSDDSKHYFIIGIEFSPDDVKLSEENIIKTILNNFELLYPTYELIKHQMIL